MIILLLLLLDNESKFKDLLINTIFYNIFEFIIVFLVLKLRIGNDFFRENITYNGGWFQYFDIKTGKIRERQDLIITFNQNIILKILISVLSSGLIVGLKKIYEL
jgi:hypothetical protein